MAGDSGQNRTEKPTPRRRERARADGDVAYSSDLTAAAGLASVATLVQMGGESWSEALGRGIESSLASITTKEWTFTHTCTVAQWVAMQLMIAAGIVSIAVISLTVMAGMMQTGVRVTMVSLHLKWDRLFSAQGLTKLWSLDSLTKTLTVLVKLSVITLVSAIAASQQLVALHALGGSTLHQVTGLGAGVVVRVLWSATGAALAIGLADYAWHLWRREQRLKMTKQEMKQEMKEEGGDPHLKARMRRMQREMAKRKGLKDVPGATVILTNPTHYAVALKYDKNSAAAPIVVAKGSDALAKQIVRIAKKHGVPVLERKPLTRALYKYVDIGKEIPSEFYQMVAEILAYLYRQKKAG
ncbi:Flagellar biosynthetic protein FlhB [Caulifigura coniformis]|uniref:Flagellar biosynthetic protein FlhB n=1 Tax=Caulifigura coniformis TaxID=2527983 RepID=A0A517SJJ9_9PLAN|nr:EscU/YscU/HrcU family type III secretion system export apparatus switch protein [Caulifigura coniformis]QDT56300.1 Flagellar biosynthetic protein FlhB [Caulifigura coniformis]